MEKEGTTESRFRKKKGGYRTPTNKRVGDM